MAAKWKAPGLPATFEVFGNPLNWIRSQFRKEKPSCCNGIVSFRSYRITVEEIPESREVLIKRLCDLWYRGEHNMHHVQPLRAAAGELGFEFTGHMSRSPKAGEPEWKEIGTP